MGMAESILFGIRIKMLTRFTTVVCGRETAEDVGKHGQGRPVTLLRARSLRQRAMEKGLGESLK